MQELKNDYVQIIYFKNITTVNILFIILRLFYWEIVQYQRQIFQRVSSTEVEIYIFHRYSQ